jgi:hypothetical protein
MLINIKINKNKIDTAPIYTIKYDKPMKFKPKIIKYIEILANNPIKNKTDIIGFLLMITNIAHKIAIKEIISSTLDV